MAYATIAQVAAYCRNLLGSTDQFTVSTSPNVIEVESFLTSGCGVINTNLAAWGYDTPVASGTALYDILSDLNALYAAARAEMTRSNIVLAPGERTRGQVFAQMFNDGMGDLHSLDLSGAGATRPGATGTITGGAYLYVGGISYADKSTVTSDTDRVKPRFERDMFRFSDTVSPQDEDDD